MEFSKARETIGKQSSWIRRRKSRRTQLRAISWAEGWRYAWKSDWIEERKNFGTSKENES